MKAAFYYPNCLSKRLLFEDLRQACEEFGFFQIIDHDVPEDLQQAVLKQCKEFFDLPIEVKEKYSKGNGQITDLDED